MLLSLILALGSTQDAALRFAHSSLETETPDQLLSLLDMTGDGRLEVVLYTGFGIQVLAFDASGKLGSTPLAEYTWESESIAWTLVDMDADGALELVTYEDGERGAVHHLRAGKGFEKSPLIEHKADVPRGAYRMDFMRDVNGDGRQDIVLPLLGKFAIFIQTKSGAWEEPLLIQYQTRVSLDVGSPSKLGSEFGQEIRVPWFDLCDVDGDGIQDLVSETTDKIRFHLGTPAISAAPSWTLDLEALRAELPASDGLDFDNLLGLAARGVEWKLADLDGQEPNELILRVGSKFRIYKDGSRYGPLGSPSQVLKSSGNVLFYVLRNVLGDGAPELQLLRGEKIGLGQVIRWLVLPGSIDFDVFTYENQAGVFSRRPTRRNKLTLGIPRILAFADRMQELEARQQEKGNIPARRSALQADARADDILDVVGDELLVYLNSAPVEELAQEAEELSTEGAILGFLEQHVDQLGESGSKSFDLGDVEKWVSFEGARLREACSGKTPELRISLPSKLSEVRIRSLDLNRNAKQDFIVLGHPPRSDSGEGASPLWELHFFVH